MTRVCVVRKEAWLPLPNAALSCRQNARRLRHDVSGAGSEPQPPPRALPGPALGREGHPLRVQQSGPPLHPDAAGRALAQPVAALGAGRRSSASRPHAGVLRHGLAGPALAQPVAAPAGGLQLPDHTAAAGRRPSAARHAQQTLYTPPGPPAPGRGPRGTQPPHSPRGEIPH